ncbi:enoyl-CoA hydratase [Sphingopyxis kveilinensis]|uniref:enoyl-CoA hydratase n=1 Tax=Sphingopyxis kveilinensis TaxID=3114367 RepID=UPI003BAFB502
MTDFETIATEMPEPGIMRIILDRPKSRNAQNTQMLCELNEAFDIGARDDSIKVIILAANGPHFSSGHDLAEQFEDQLHRLENRSSTGSWGGYGKPGAESRMGIEKEIYLGFSERWRNIPKVTIAEVQGKVISGGLMLVWPCDIVIAADDAQFQDNTLLMGMTGAEFFNHPWEVGVRKAKEMLFTADFLSAEDARRLGGVNHVVPRGELSEFTMALARKIAAAPGFALKLAKESVNVAQDHQGRRNAMDVSFALHQLGHSHNMQVHGAIVDPIYFKSRT